MKIDYSSEWKEVIAIDKQFEIEGSATLTFYSNGKVEIKGTGIVEKGVAFDE